MNVKRAPGGGMKPRGEFSKMPTKTMSFRIPKTILDGLKESAELSNRSLTQELFRRLQQSLEQEPPSEAPKWQLRTTWTKL